MKRSAVFYLFMMLFAMVIQLPIVQAGEITNIVYPDPDLGALYIGTQTNLTFGATFSNASQSMTIILLNYSNSHFDFRKFTAEINGINITDQFNIFVMTNYIILNSSSVTPANGTLNVEIRFEPLSEGTPFFFWRFISIAYQPPPIMPTVRDIEGQTQVNLNEIEPPPPPPPPPPPFIPPPIENEKPVANAGADQEIFQDRMLYFDGSKSYDPDGVISSYLWIFGDGSTEQGEVVSHTYSLAGSYEVTLIVIDDLGGTSNNTLFVTVKELPLNPTVGIDEMIGANQTGYVITAIETTNTTITVNTTDSVTISILKYTTNPYPEVPLPPTTLSTIVDIAVSNLDAIQWPLHVERYYSDAEINGLDESKLVMYYYKDEAWYMCQDSGVHTARNIVWANMYENELSGSPTTIGQHLLPATFELSELSVNPAIVEVGKNVTITFKVRNIGDVPGNYTINLKINGVFTDTETLFLNDHTITTALFVIARETTGMYIIEIDDLQANFTVTAPLKPAEFEVSDLVVSPTQIESGKAITASVKVKNIGGKAGNFTLSCYVDNSIEDTNTITLGVNESTVESFIIVSDAVGIHHVEINGIPGLFTVNPSNTPAEFIVSDLDLYPKDVNINELVTVSFNLSNIGEESGTYTVDIIIDDSIAYSKSMTLNGGESISLNFTTFSNTEGYHTVEVDELSKTFTVSMSPDDFNNTYTDTQKLIIISVFLIIVISASVYYYQSRKN